MLVSCFYAKWKNNGGSCLYPSYLYIPKCRATEIPIGVGHSAFVHPNSPPQKSSLQAFCGGDGGPTVSSHFGRGFWNIPSLKLTWHLKITSWKRRLLLETIILKGVLVSFREGNGLGGWIRSDEISVEEAQQEDEGGKVLWDGVMWKQRSLRDDMSCFFFQTTKQGWVFRGFFSIWKRSPCGQSIDIWLLQVRWSHQSTCWRLPYMGIVSYWVPTKGSKH